MGLFIVAFLFFFNHRLAQTSACWHFKHIRHPGNSVFIW